MPKDIKFTNYKDDPAAILAVETPSIAPEATTPAKIAWYAEGYAVATAKEIYLNNTPLYGGSLGQKILSDLTNPGIPEVTMALPATVTEQNTADMLYYAYSNIVVDETVTDVGTMTDETELTSGYNIDTNILESLLQELTA